MKFFQETSVINKNAKYGIYISKHGIRMYDHFLKGRITGLTAMKSDDIYYQVQDKDERIYKTNKGGFVWQEWLWEVLEV